MEIELAALIISAAAFVLSGWAAWNSHRQAEASKRQADAAEDQLEMMREEQDALDARPWRLTHFKGDTYRLTNGGSLIAYDVDVAGASKLQWVEAPEEGKLGPGESATFLAVMYAGSGFSRRMTIRWATQPGGELTELTELLPPK